MRVLQIEDDITEGAFLALALRHDGIGVDTASTATDGLSDALTGEYDVVVLDLSLPDVDGMQVLKELRAARCGVPVMILSGRLDDREKLKGFALGALDFMTKPFNVAVLIARLHALVRRGANVPNEVAVGDLVISLDSPVVTCRGEPLFLSQGLYRIIQILARHVNVPVSQEAIFTNIYAGDEPPLDSRNVLTVQMTRLRHAIEKATGRKGTAYIRTIARGYMLIDPPRD